MNPSRSYTITYTASARRQMNRSTRRGDYRALYEINDGEVVVTVVTVAHRRDVYRSR